MNQAERCKGLSRLIKHLQETNMRPQMMDGVIGINAELLNEVAAALGCEGSFATNRKHPGESGGSLIDCALIYQNLLLAKRIEALEFRLNSIKGVL